MYHNFKNITSNIIFKELIIRKINSANFFIKQKVISSLQGKKVFNRKEVEDGEV